MQEEGYQNEPVETSSPDINQRDLADKLLKNAGKIEALALVAGNDDFNEWSEEVRSNFMWTLSDLTTQQRKDIDTYLTRA